MIKNQTDNTRSGSERNKNPFCAKFTAMRKATISLLIFTVSLCFSFGCLLGQNNKPDKKKKKNQGKQRQEETIDYYKKWLEQDVDYIIAKDERAVFEALSTDAERDNFIEQFWFRRDPDPRSPSNEFKTEHYRRIRFANERFHAGMPGWMTDRGRVYIMFGPPDNKESYPAGGWYERKHHEGGGFTSVFPFEVWQYNYIEGVETDVELEFVDPSASNLYRLTLDPQEKDEFLHVPMSGFTHFEMFDPDATSRLAFDRRVGIREGGTRQGYGIGERTKDSPFQKAELMMRIGKAAALRYTDLKQLVTTSIEYHSFPYQVATDFIQINPDSYLVPVTLVFDNSEISWEAGPNGFQSKLQVYGSVTTLTKRIIFEFDDDIELKQTAEQYSSTLAQYGTYQRKLVLKPGKYRLDLIVKDTISGKVGTQPTSLEVPKPSETTLNTSSVILTKEIEATDQDMVDPFVMGPFKMLPQVDRRFTNSDFLGFYVEIYNFELDQASQTADMEILYGIAPAGKEPERYSTMRRGIGQAADRLYVARMVQLNDLPPGRYQLICKIRDRIKDESITLQERFRIQ